VATTTPTKQKTKPRSQGPKRRDEPKRPWWLYPLAALGLITAGVAIAALTRTGGTESTVPAEGLPNTRDYHSLLVSPTDARSLLLGTHDGLFRSGDGGRTWERAELSGRDAMNLARQQGGRTVWAAGHLVLAKSTDGGTTWTDTSPRGLPGLDVHGFAVDPADPKIVYAAVAGKGLFRSVDGGVTFATASTKVGPGVMALAVLPGGKVLAGDMQQQALAVSTDGGKSWKGVIQAQIMGLAVSPANRQRVLASGPGVLLSTNAGRSWRQTLRLDAGTGPVAWAASKPGIAYVVGFDRSLYRTDDGGETWTPIVRGES
jgi:photosystem II stability/assembly factor-like uncharacterized protein